MADPVDVSAGTPGQQDAFAVLSDVLNQYGLSSLVAFAWQHIIAGDAQTQILQDLRNTAEYKARFPGMAIRQQLGLSAIGEGDYVNYENTARGLMRAAGLPGGFYDQPEDFAALIGKGVSPVELQARINNGVGKMLQAPPEVRDAFRKLYGVGGDGNLTAYFLDPDKATPVLERQAQAASISGAGTRFSYDIDRQMSERLAQHGVTDDAANQGFERLRQLDPLFHETVSETGDLNADQQGAEAVFGLSGQAERAVQQRQEERVGAFSGGGGAQSGTTGLYGLGSARSV